MYRKIVLFAVILIFLTSCGGFQLVDRNFSPKGNSIAVITGINDEMNEYLALSMTEALKKRSSFKVVSQKRVRKSLRHYPVNIDGPYSAAYINIEPDFNHTDTKKIKKIQKKLGVDYIYVLWAPTSVTTNGSINSINVIGQMFESPTCKEVGRARFDAVSKVKGKFVLGRAAKDEKTGIDTVADRVAMQIAQLMKKQK
jgi:hypothetical protein